MVIKKPQVNFTSGVLPKRSIERKCMYWYLIKDCIVYEYTVTLTNSTVLSLSILHVSTLKVLSLTT